MSCAAERARRALVVGATGFIGARLVSALRDRGDAVVGAGRAAAPPVALGGIDWVRFALGDAAPLAAELTRCDVVYHLACTTVPARSDLDRCADVRNNLLGTVDLLDACARAGVPRIVFLSSGGAVYGSARSLPIPETAPTEPISSHGIVKLAIEKYLAAYERQHGIAAVALRVANPFGPGQTGLAGQGAVGVFLRRALTGEPIEVWGSGAAQRDYLFVDDVVDAILRASDYGGPERVFNVGSGSGRTLLDVICAVERAVGRPVERRFRSAPASLVEHNVLDCARAARELRWEPRIEFEAGVAVAARWMREALAAEAAASETATAAAAVQA